MTRKTPNAVHQIRTDHPLRTHARFPAMIGRPSKEGAPHLVAEQVLVEDLAIGGHLARCPWGPEARPNLARPEHGPDPVILGSGGMGPIAGSCLGLNGGPLDTSRYGPKKVARSAQWVAR